MATTIRDLVVKLGVDANARKVAAFDKALGGVKKAMGLLVLGAAGLSTALVKIASDTASTGDEAAKAAKRIGVTAEEMQELTFAAQIGGATMADIEVGFRRLASNALDASRGTGEAKESFDELGVAVTNADGTLKSQLDLFEDVAGALEGVENTTLRAALAQDIFGRGGSKLLPLLNEGKGGIRALRREAQGLGLVLSEDATKQAEEFQDSMLRLKSVALGLRNTIGTALIPRFIAAADSIRAWFLANRELIRQRLDKFLDGVAKAAKQAERAMDGVARIVEALGGAENAIAALGALAAGLGALKGLSVLASLVPVIQGAVALIGGVTLATVGEFVLIALAAVAAVVALGAGIQDLITFFRGGDSAIGRFIEKFQDTNTIAGKAIALFRRIGSVISDVAEVALPVLMKALGVVFRFWTIQMRFAAKVLGFLFEEVAIPLANLWLDNVTAVIDFVREAFAGLGIDIGETMDGIFEAINEAFDALERFLGIANVDLGTMAPALAGGPPGMLPGPGPDAPTGGGTTARALAALEVGGDNVKIEINASGMDEKRLASEMDRQLNERDKRKRRQTRERFRGREA